MGIFSRFSDIISSNISSMLDSAEDPEKLIRLMIREMEETLVELKSSCAATMAESATIGRQLTEAQDALALWDNRALLALKANREDMAREAVLETVEIKETIAHLEKELAAYEELVRKCREDIALLEDRINATRDKQRLLASRHNQAQLRRSAREKARKLDSLEAMKRFDSLTQRIERMENEADLAYTKPSQPAHTFRELEKEDEVSTRLAQLREKLEKKD